MAFFDEFKRDITRRHFFSQGSHLLGTASLASWGLTCLVRLVSVPCQRTSLPKSSR